VVALKYTQYIICVVLRTFRSQGLLQQLATKVY
jgi:hypothetical protein